MGVQQKAAICVQHLRQTSDAKNQPESARRKRARTGLRQRQLQNLTARWRWHCFNGFFFILNFTRFKRVLMLSITTNFTP